MKAITFLLLFYLLVPVLLIYFCKKSPLLKRIGAVVLAYAVGLVAGNTGLIPSPGPVFRSYLKSDAKLPGELLHQLIETGQLTPDDLLVNQVLNLQDMLTTLTILVAIPLLLFSLDLRKWLGLAKGALLSLALAMVSLIIAVLAGFFLFRSDIEQAPQVAGMLTGVYTGGTVNLAAIGKSLQVGNNIYIITHTSDLIIGTIALLFLMTIAQKVFHTFLPRFEMVHKAENYMTLNDENGEMENFDSLFRKSNFPDLLKALGLAIAIMALGAGVSFLFREDLRIMMAILTITTLGLAASLHKKINQLKNSFQFGMYLIIVFSLVVSSMANLSNIITNFEETASIFYYVLLVVFGSMAIHVGLSRVFHVDADTTIIAITALTYSPPFVPAVAGAIKNKNVIISGLAIGVLGYAFGTYLGVAIGRMLGAF